MDKISTIDFSADRLLAMAAEAVENHNYIGALKLLNKNAVLNGNDEDSFMLYAEIFDDMGLYEKCVNGWFKYIDFAEEGADFAEAYEGLAISFMNLQQENFAAYYYNKLLMETDAELSPENRRDIIDSFLHTETKPLRFAYPPRLADYSKEINEGIAAMRENDYDGAIKRFDMVGEGSDKYLAARNYVAMCNIICDRCDEAEQECERILSIAPSDIQALTTLSAVKSQQKKTEEARALAERLIAVKAENPDDIYKIATVCCENKMHAQAYELLLSLKGELEYDFSILFFRAVAACNCGKLQESLDVFDLILTIYPNAVVAEYFRDEVYARYKGASRSNDDLEYFYRMPRKESEYTLEVLSAYAKMTDSMARKFDEVADIEQCVRWCFDEGDGNSSYDLHLLGATCAVKAELDDTVRDILLDAFVSDAVKMEMINQLVQKNKEGAYGVVVCNLFRRITLVPLEIGKAKRKTFLHAYGLAFSRFAMLSGDYNYMLNSAATKLYYKLEREDRLDDARGATALAAAIVRFSQIKESGLSDESMLAFFGTDAAKVKKILGEE